ncbi:hypothetical protein B7494_g3086 [Chlorociboria aeruginascens]|nr:hypothetical protein B7494_g3086 [Chlorociboria aeruginascens]
MSPTVQIGSSAEFAKLLSSSSIVVSDYWCGPCKTIAPTYESLSVKHSKPNRITFTKINVDNQQAIAQQYDVRAMPTFIIFRNGSVHEKIKGADPNGLTTAVENAVRLAGAAKPSYTFSSTGRTLGGPPARGQSLRRPFGLKGIVDAIIAFLGLYFISLFSFDPYVAAETSAFNIHRQNRMAFPSPVAWHNAPYPAIDPSSPNLSAKGKVVAITGGGAGIGLAITRAFAKAGASKIAILGRTESTLLEAKKSIEALYPELSISTYVADISEEVAVTKAFEKIRSELGLVDSYTVDEWWRGYEVNVKGSFLVAKISLATALAPGAVLINLTSGAGHATYFPGYSSYATSKLAGIKLWEYLQAEHPDKHFVSVHPGVIKTAMEAKAAAAGYSMPHDDIELPASFMVWVASPEARFLDGRTVWSNWDVEELKAKVSKIQEGNLLTSGLSGWPSF